MLSFGRLENQKQKAASHHESAQSDAKKRLVCKLLADRQTGKLASACHRLLAFGRDQTHRLQRNLEEKQHETERVTQTKFKLLSKLKHRFVDSKLPACFYKLVGFGREVGSQAQQKSLRETATLKRILGLLATAASAKTRIALD